MKKIYNQSFTPVVATGRHGGFRLGETVYDEGTMRQGQRRARDMSEDTGSDIEYSVYNEYLRKWVLLGTFHPDGTATDTFGERRRFTDDPINPWAPV